MPYPGPINNHEGATGLLIRSLKINNFYLMVDDFSVNQKQDIEINQNFVQGGPGAAISNIGAKRFEGSLTCPLRVDRNGNLDPAVKELLKHAESPMTALRIDTNHVASHYGITAGSVPTINNELLSLDCVLIKNLKISCSPDDEYVKLTADFVGMIDGRINLEYVAPSDATYLKRALSWLDLDAYREESQMRSLSGFSINIENQSETHAFLMPITTAAFQRNDQIQFIGVKGTKWTGEMNEVMRRGLELHQHIHGGWMVNENLTFKLGKLQITFHHPLFNISDVPLSAKILKRTTSWTKIQAPNEPMTAGGLFTFNE